MENNIIKKDFLDTLFESVNDKDKSIKSVIVEKLTERYIETNKINVAKITTIITQNINSFIDASKSNMSSNFAVVKALKKHYIDNNKDFAKTVAEFDELDKDSSEIINELTTSDIAELYIRYVDVTARYVNAGQIRTAALNFVGIIGRINAMVKENQENYSKRYSVS